MLRLYVLLKYWFRHRYAMLLLPLIRPSATFSRKGRRALYKLQAFILVLGITNAYAGHQLAPLVGQPQTLLTQCLGKPTESWGFGQHNYLTYNVPGTSCQLIAKTKRYQITHAKLTDSQGRKKKLKACASPALTCLGFTR